MFRTALTTAAASLVALGTLAAIPATATEAATKVTAKDLAPASVVTWYGKNATYKTVETTKGATALHALCQTKPMDAYSPNASFTRWYAHPASAEYHHASATIGSFASHKQAVAMQKAIAAQFDGCQDQLKSWGDTPIAPQTKRTVNLTGGGTAIVFTNTYRDTLGTKWFEARAVINTGTHVELFSMSDYVTKKHSDADIVTTATKAAGYLR